MSQTFLARIATTYLTKKLNTEIKIEKLEIKSFQRLSLRNILIKDQHSDTLLFAGYISASLNQPLLGGNFSGVQKLELEEADIRIKKYKGEDFFNMQFLADFAGKKDTVDSTGRDVQFSIGELDISNSNFIFKNQNKIILTEGVNYSNIKISNLNLLAQGINILNDTVFILIKNANMQEKSGFTLDSLACNFKLSPKLMQAKNLHVHTAENDLDLDVLFDFDSFRDFRDFINKVRITTSIRPSLINLTEVGYFAPVMFSMDNRLRVSGDIAGTVDNFRAKNLRFGAGVTTQFMGDIQINGLPDIRETFSHLSVKDFVTSVNDVRSFRLPTEDVFIDIPKELAVFGKVRINGKFTGFYNDFVSYANFSTNVGQVKTDILLRMNEKNTIEYIGHLEANDFDIGVLLNARENIGKLNLVAHLNGFGTKFDDMEITMAGVVDSLVFFQNVYNEIAINGNLINKKFTGELNVTDEFMSLDFIGSLDYSGNVPAYDFNAEINDAWLHKINLINHKESSKLSTHLNINFMGDEIDNMQGIIKIDSTYYAEEGRNYFMKNLSLSITRDADEFTLVRLYSDFVDFTLEGNYTLREMPYRINEIANLYFDTIVPGPGLKDIDLADQDFVFNIDLKNTKPFSDIFLPDLTITGESNITGGFSSKTRYLFCYSTFPEVNFKGNRFKSYYLDFETPSENAWLVTGAESLYFSDTLNTDSLQLQLTGMNNSIRYDLSWDEKNKKTKNSGYLSGQMNFTGPQRYEIKVNQADIYFSDSLWTVNPANSILIDTSYVKFENFGFNSKTQGIFTNGIISPNVEDTLLFGFNEFNLSNFDLLLHNLNINLDGYLSGQISVVDFYNSPFYLADLNISDLYYNKEKLGRAEISTIWDSKEKAFNINGDLIYIGNVGERKTLDVTGKYYPGRESDNFDIEVLLNNFKLSVLEPFTSSFSSDIEGLATGSLFLKGSKSKPELNGEIDLIHAAMLINYTRIKYYFADKVFIDPNHIYFKNMIVYDSLTNQCLVSGDIYHDHLRDFNFDLDISTTNLWGLNTGRSDNDIFYGQAYASGGLRIYGPVEQLTMDIDVRSEKGTDIKIPISYGTDVGENDYIIFVNQETYTDEQEKEYTTEPGGVALNLGLDITNDADIQMFMPYGMGNVKAKGKGDLKMNMTPAGEFTMDGEYAIDRGSFFFTLQNIINRNFEISRGSRVVWTGDPYDARINMKAVYKVKTSLGEYGPPSDSATRVPVDCIISLKNRLLDPEIRFTVEFPDLKDDTKQTIYSRLDTNDQAMMSQQMISLLVLNSFMSSEGYSGSVGFNTFSLLTNQLNNWLSKISNDFDIGVNYRPGDDVSAQEVEVALSTQLFDNRVTIDGNVGMRGEEEDTQNTNNLIGEVVVEVRITPDGRFRAKAFNKSNNDYLYKNYSPYTQGVGVFYTQEFNRLGDLFGRKKEKKNNKVTDEQSSKNDSQN
ncbi:MAG: translocation/assembly module TamB [Bacteroidales bacterium]|nr:translocation/assembly module TamB [Bacteroidales bacterium]